MTTRVLLGIEKDFPVVKDITPLLEYGAEYLSTREEENKYITLKKNTGMGIEVPLFWMREEKNGKTLFRLIGFSLENVEQS